MPGAVTPETSRLVEQVDALVNQVVMASGVNDPGPMHQLGETLARLEQILTGPPTTAQRSVPLVAGAVVVKSHPKAPPFIALGHTEISLPSAIRILALATIIVLIVLATINW